MAIEITHAFQSAKADGSDPTRIQPSHWNDDHVIELAGLRLIGRYDSSAGAAQEISLGTGLEFSVGGSLQLTSAFQAQAGKLVGTIFDWGGPELPALHLWCDGAAINRGTYNALFNALSLQTTGNTTSGSPTLASVAKDIRFLGLTGAVIEGTNIPAGTTIVSATATTITMSANATGTLVGGPIRILPHGAGDGSSTFNVPDRRDYVPAGRGNMGGTTAGRLTSPLDGTRLGAKGGTQSHALTIAELATHTHTSSIASSGAHTHSGTTDGGGAHTPVVTITAGGGAHTHSGTTAADGGHTPSVTITAGGGAHTHSGTTAADGDHSHGGNTGFAGEHKHTVSGGGDNAAAGGDRLSLTGAGTNDDTSTVSDHRHTITASGDHTHTFSIASSGTHNHTATAAAVPDHTHTFSIASSGTHSHTATADAVPNHTHTFSIASSGAHTHTVTIDNTGSGTAHPNVQPTAITNFIIFAGV